MGALKVDSYDQRILEEIQADGRISNQDLAERIGLSPSPCLRRVRQLEEDGVIDRYVALLNPDKMGLKMTALIHISMDKHTPERFERFEQQVSGFPEVQSCYLITGQSADYILKVVVRDMDHFQAFLLGKLTRIEGVSGVHSSFVMRKVVDKTSIPMSIPI